MKWRTVIVDDEPLARERLRTLLENDPEIDLIGEYADGSKAVAGIRKHKPDLVFLDVQIPGPDGFAVLETLGIENTPSVIFVTAYDHYALKAFDVHALDYLLKPFDRERFERALRRAKAHLAREKSGDLQERLLAFMEGWKTKPKYLSRLVIKSSGRVFFVKAEEIDWIEAEGNYVRLHLGAESHLLRETMGGLEAKLDPDKFLRIHRSRMVNVERIKELKPWFRGEYLVVLRSGQELPLSRGYRDRLDSFIRH